MTTLTREFAVEGMHWAGCVASVTSAVTRVPGVSRVDVSLEDKSAKVEFDEALASTVAIVAAIEGVGFTAYIR